MKKLEKYEILKLLLERLNNQGNGDALLSVKHLVNLMSKVDFVYFDWDERLTLEENTKNV